MPAPEERIGQKRQTWQGRSGFLAPPRLRKAGFSISFRIRLENPLRVVTIGVWKGARAFLPLASLFGCHGFGTVVTLKSATLGLIFPRFYRDLTYPD
jgi:hypothetical protein